MSLSPEHEVLFQPPVDGSEYDFCRCLERIDLLFQQDYLQRVGVPPIGLHTFFLSDIDIAFRLADPEGKPVWLENQSAYLPDSADALALRLQRLMAAFHLTPCERDILLAALLPRLSTHYSALPDSGVTDGIERRLLTQLFTATQTEYRALQAALHPSSPLFLYQLLNEASPAAGRKTLVYSVHESVWQFFCGNEPLVTWQHPQVRRVEPDSSGWYPLSFCKQVFSLCLRTDEEPLPVVVLEGLEQDGREQALSTLLTEYGYVMLSLNVEALAEQPEVQQLRIMADIVRDALLYRAGLMLENCAELTAGKRGYARALERLLKAVKLPLFILADASTEMAVFSGLACVHLTMPPLSSGVKTRMLTVSWPDRPDAEAQQELALLAQRYAFKPDELPLLLREAGHHCRLRGTDATLTPEDLRLSLARRSRKNFGKLAQRITPVRTFDDIVMTPALKTQMAEIIAAIRLRESVTEKHFRQKTGGKTGISALFYGDSGTGKTLAAEVLAHYLRVDLIKIDLSTVVNKYIGETEKNLARIFDLAQADSGVLFFDEADALFGKRSETKDAHDRHANIEVSYLLQRLESYPGLVILATNNRNHLDSAFNRRFTFITRFTYPDATLREQMWRAVWPATLPLAEDIDFAALAARAELTGANIRNVALLAAVLAADAGSETVTLSHIELAIRRELGKLGRLAI